jgi:hypothetical protein
MTPRHHSGVRCFALLVLLLPLYGCQGISLHKGTVGDAEIKAAGEWTLDDQMARDVIDSRWTNPSLYSTGRPAEPIPVRRLNTAQQFTDRLLIGKTSIPLPTLRVLWPGYEPGYILRGERNAIILLNRGKPPAVMAIDPCKPIDHPREKTDEVVYQMLREAIDRDLKGLKPSPAAP